MRNNEIIIEQSGKKNMFVKRFIILFSIVIVIMLIAVLFYAKHQNTETWKKYKPYNFTTMTQDQQEKYVYDYILDKYGVEVNVKSIGIPGGTDAFDRFYYTANVSPKTSSDPKDTYFVFFKSQINGEICDTFFFRDIQEYVTDTIQKDIMDLPYDFYMVSHTYLTNPYYPTYKMEYLAKNDPHSLFVSEKTFTTIDIYFNSSDVEHLNEIKSYLRDKLGYTRISGWIYFVDDINAVDISSLDRTESKDFF